MKKLCLLILLGVLLSDACMPVAKPKSTASAVLPTAKATLSPRETPELVPTPTSTAVTLTIQALAVQMETRHSGNWTIYTAPEWAQKEPIAISSIIVATDRTSWFGTMGGPVSIGTGIYHFDGKAWTRYTTENGLPASEFSSISTNPDGALWFATFCCGVFRFDGKTWTIYTTANGLVDNDVRSSVFAPDGTLWFGTLDKGVSHFDGKTWTNYNQNNGLWGYDIGHIGVLSDGVLLFSNSNRASTRVTRYDGQHWTTFSVPPSLAKDNSYEVGNYVEDVATTSDGSIWFATEKDGVYRLTENNWTHYTTHDGLLSDNVFCVTVAADGALWFGTLNGISRFDGKEWTNITMRDGLPDKVNCPIAAEANGTMWLGSASAIYRYQP